MSKLDDFDFRTMTHEEAAVKIRELNDPRFEPLAVWAETFAGVVAGSNNTTDPDEPTYDVTITFKSTDIDMDDAADFSSIKTQFEDMVKTLDVDFDFEISKVDGGIALIAKDVDDLGKYEHYFTSNKLYGEAGIKVTVEKVPHVSEGKQA